MSHLIILSFSVFFIICLFFCIYLEYEMSRLPFFTRAGPPSVLPLLVSLLHYVAERSRGAIGRPPPHAGLRGLLRGAPRRPPRALGRRRRLAPAARIRPPGPGGTDLAVFEQFERMVLVRCRLRYLAALYALLQLLMMVLVRVGRILQLFASLVLIRRRGRWRRAMGL